MPRCHGDLEETGARSEDPGPPSLALEAPSQHAGGWGWLMPGRPSNPAPSCHCAPPSPSTWPRPTTCLATKALQLTQTSHVSSTGMTLKVPRGTENILAPNGRISKSRSYDTRRQGSRDVASTPGTQSPGSPVLNPAGAGLASVIKWLPRATAPPRPRAEEQSLPGAGCPWGWHAAGAPCW